MTMKKRYYSFVLTMLMSMFALCVSAHDIEVKNADGVTIYYKYINNNTELEVTYRGTHYTSYSNEYEGNVVIPESVTYNNKTYSVTSIGEDAFISCHRLTSITIPNSVTSIGGYAFSSCSGLTSVTIPNSVTNIGIGAFSECSGLTSIKVQEGNSVYDSRNNSNAIIVTSSNALITGCKNTVIPNSVTSIGGRAFFGCSGLTSITIPNSVTSIGSGAFIWCSGLTSVTIPNSVTSVESNAFRYCSKLTSVTIPNSVTSIESYAFSDCSSLTSITIPNSVTSIGEGAFKYCSGLTSITIPNSVTSIESYAFYDTAWYGNQPDGLVYAGKVAYKYKGTMPKNTSITIKDGTLGIAREAFYGCSGLTSITIPNSVTCIGQYAFCWCEALTSIDIPNSVTSIGQSAFAGCSGLTSITIPNSVTSIERYAFDKCSGLVSVTWNAKNRQNFEYDKSPFWNIRTQIAEFKFGEEVETIPSYLCYGMTGLTSVTIPNSVTSIGESAFSGCSMLTTATIGNSVTSIGYSAFRDCSGLTSITIPNSVTSIGEGAFSRCSGLTSITIPNSVTSIGQYAFAGCFSLTSVTIPNSVTSIGESAFAGCLGLTSIKVQEGNSVYDSRNNSNAIIVTSSNALITGCKNTVIPTSVTSIGDAAFEGCSGLTSITIPNSVTSIGEGAFVGCSGLTSVTIPNSVTSIGNYAFWDCLGLTSITIPNSVTSIGQSAFGGCSMLTTATIGKNVTSIGSSAFKDCNNLKSVYALSESPSSIAISDNSFPTSQSTLYVKKGLKDLYSKSDGWKNFVDIKEMTDEQYKELMKKANGEGGQEDIIVNVPIDVNLSSDGYATFYNASFNFKLPTGLSAQIVTLNAYGKISYKTIANGSDNGIIPKGVPVVLVSNNRSGGTYTLTSTLESASYTGANFLRGSNAQTYTSNVNGVSPSGNSDYVYYKLVYGSNNKAGWYWGANNGAAFSIDGGKAWLALPKTSPQSLDSVLFFDEDATSVDIIEQSNMNEANDAQYNMAGQRVGNGYNGIVVVNGKKIIR